MRKRVTTTLLGMVLGLGMLGAPVIHGEDMWNDDDVGFFESDNWDQDDAGYYDSDFRWDTIGDGFDDWTEGADRDWSTYDDAGDEGWFDV